MEVTYAPTRDRFLDFTPDWGPAGRCRVRVFDEVRVVVVSELVDNPGPSVRSAMPALAMVLEEMLDVRFFGTSWRLVEHHRQETDEDVVLLVTFGGYDPDGHLWRTSWQEAPAAMGWVRDALQDGP